ncbi:MAG: hypothetical protein CMM93_09310 [Rickettsiales bacterium]|nr:hypothetical protein [Rickettsiales bacterium]|tara:strand:+ start:1715 stop:2707 length:993 start_codon:yes stop_codon:yes gene_type:complete
MIAYLARRALWGVFVVVVVVTLVFMVVFAIGDPAATSLGANASPEQVAQFEEREGLDHSLARQYASYLGVMPCVRKSSANYDGGEGFCGLLQLDFGSSYRHKEPVFEVIATRFPRTLLLAVMTLFFELLIGLGLGVLAATRKGSLFDTGFMATAFLGISLPTYVTGPIFLLVFAFLYGWFPVGGYGVDFWDHVYHGILPAFTLAIVGAATYARVMRSEMVEALRNDYIRTAKAKGVSGSGVVLRHAFRNALLPVVTLVGLSMAVLVSGAIITERVFAWPGMGSLAIEAVLAEDAPIIMGVVLIFSIIVQVANLLADLAVAALDPRIRLGN